MVLAIGFYTWFSAPPPPELHYVEETEVTLYAGYVDGELSEDSMTSYEFGYPTSLAVYEDKTVYVADETNTGDGITLLELDSTNYSLVTPIPLGDYKANVVHIYQDSVYVLATKENEEGSLFACVLRVDGPEYQEIMDALPLTDDSGVQEQTIADFVITDEGKYLWLVIGDLSEGENKFAVRKMVHEYDAQRKDFYRYDSNSEQELDLSIAEQKDNRPRNIADAADNLYVSLPENNLICVKEHDDNDFQKFVGVRGNSDLNDRGKPTFRSPASLAMDSQYLYVWDSGIIRRISIKNGAVDKVETLAGNIGEDGIAVDSYEKKVSGKEAALTQYGINDASITVLEDGVILLSDPANGVIYQIRTS